MLLLAESVQLSVLVPILMGTGKGSITIGSRDFSGTASITSLLVALCAFNVWHKKLAARARLKAFGEKQNIQNPLCDGRLRASVSALNNLTCA